MMRNPLTTTVSFLVFSLGIARHTGAQIVNVLGQAHRVEEGVSSKAVMGLEWRTGNTEVFTVSGGARVAMRKGRNLLLLLGSGDLGYARGNKYVAKSFEHLRYRVRLWRLVAGETFVQHSFDQFGRLTLRLLYGIGPRFEVAEWDSGHLALGSDWMLEVERLQSGVEADAGQRSIVQRWSNYIEFSAALGDTLTCSQTVFYQPMFADLPDFRVLSESSVEVKATSHFGFVTAFTLAYDSRPPRSVRRLDTSLKSSLTVTF